VEQAADGEAAALEVVGWEAETSNPRAEPEEVEAGEGAAG